MNGTGNALVVSGAYVAIAFGLTIWLARTLFTNGRVFLHDVWGDKPEVADAVNRLLVVGFYMFSLGWALNMFRASRDLDVFDSVQLLITRLAYLLMILAVVHFANVFVFWRIRARREQRSLPAPVARHAKIRVPPAPSIPQE